LKPDAPESTRAFLLNHVISERLPGSLQSNSDPITGQAAWFDVRVRVERAADHEQNDAGHDFGALHPPPGVTPGPDVLQYGSQFHEAAE
jgi:sulfite dehydrogenase (quinone) subunit SoeA